LDSSGQGGSTVTTKRRLTDGELLLGQASGTSGFPELEPEVQLNRLFFVEAPILRLGEKFLATPDKRVLLVDLACPSTSAPE
jgi:hypothetical protein